MPTRSIAFRDCRYAVPNLSAAKTFYAAAFGVPTYFDERTWVVFEIRGYQLWLEPNDATVESVFTSTHPLYTPERQTGLTFWAVDDVKAVCARFKKLGGTIFKAPKSNGPFTDAVVIDPWNNKLGLHSQLFR